ncbi:MAG: sigma 54-interacting transcriptional regulator [Myxococcota bacterium]
MQDHEPGWAVLLPDESGWRWQRIDERQVLGSDRHEGNGLRGPGVAPRHCRLVVHGGRLHAVDLGSLAGTTLRGEKVGARPVALESGDVLRLGRVPVVVVRRELLGGADWLRVGELGSASPLMHEAFVELALAAACDWPLLLWGESGCGKELAARVVHTRSAHADGPWVAVNCGALPAETLLAELFGAAKGAYTGSVETRKGAFERADGGTLFLDEVGELSPAAQAALLRVLEVGEVQVLGGPVRRIDVRLICATHRDLRSDVAAGRFRLDLLHRLAVTEVGLPPLRARPEDVVPLLDELLGGTPLPYGAEAILRAHPWPGNVRELRNVSRRLLTSARWGEPTLDEVQGALFGASRPLWALACGMDDAGVAEPQVPWSTGPRGAGGRLPTTLSPAQSRERLRQVADAVAASPTTAAAHRSTGLPRGTFYRYLKQLRTQAGCDDGVVLDNASGF